MTLKRIFSMIAIIFISNNIYAVEWSAEGTVDKTRVYIGEYIYGKLEGVTLTCGNNNFRLASNLRLETSILSILLAAQTSGKKVQLLQEPGNCVNNTTSVIKGAMLVN
ncbi:MAG: hypothetical protein KZQ93_05025 [Candidatus Thiodiazotropha sp. (ex Monitilora ramsayi)]|nr:hypothetical protein [Candidatus Thiodiazotropha sp. (ex Monitilora ramsayi)]